MMSSYVRWGTCCDFFSFDATKYEGGRGYCRCSRELSLCLMQKVRKKFAGPEKGAYLCSEKRTKVLTIQKYTTMIAIAFFTTTILASIALRLGTMFMERR